MGLAILLGLMLVGPALLLLVPRRGFPFAVGIIVVLSAIVALRSLTLGVGCREFECVGAIMGFAAFAAVAIPSAIAGMVRWKRFKQENTQDDQ